MARPSAKAPEPRVVIVRPEGSDDYYEIYIMRPVKVGGVTKLAWMNYGTDEGHSGFDKIESAARSLLESKGHADIANRADLLFSGQQSSVKKQSTKLSPVAGTVLLEKGVWYEFCSARQIAKGDLKALHAMYDLSSEERQRWGLPI